MLVTVQHAVYELLKVATGGGLGQAAGGVGDELEEFGTADEFEDDVKFCGGGKDVM